MANGLKQVDHTNQKPKPLARILIGKGGDGFGDLLGPETSDTFGDSQSVKPCDNNLKKVISLAERMIRLADTGDADREDTGCGILYGMLRDSGYKIMQLAEAEKLKHIAKGWWDEHC